MGTCSLVVLFFRRSSQVKSSLVPLLDLRALSFAGRVPGTLDVRGLSGGPRHQQLPAAAGLAIVGPMTGAQVCPCLDKIRICPAASRIAQDRVQDTRSTDAAVKLGVLSLSSAMV